MTISDKFFGTLETFGGTGVLIGAFYSIRVVDGDFMSLAEMMFYFGIALVLLKEGIDVMFKGIELMLPIKNKEE